jgi:peptide/nickel transport system substrate-binding protein
MLLQRYHSSTTGTFFQGEWLRDAEFDAKLEEALQIIDNEQRFAKYAELENYINDLAPTLFVFDQLQKHAYQPYLDWPVTKGVVYPFMGYNQYFAFVGINPPQ